MDLCSVSVINNLMKKHKVKFSKVLGQNFIIDSSICPKMADECVGIEKKSIGVIEIGPGIGVLTKELAQRADKVVSIELDKRLLPVLSETMSEFTNVEIINQDILSVNISNLIKDKFKGIKSVKICANLPYYITSLVIMKILEEECGIDSIIVMVQKEAAERICALPGSRNCGVLSFGVRYYSDPVILFNISRKCFFPSPKVDSSVIKIDVREHDFIDAKYKTEFFKVVKAAFLHRRKTILNSLSSGMNVNKCLVSNVLSNLGISELARAEELSIEDFLNISQSMFRKT